MYFLAVEGVETIRKAVKLEREQAYRIDVNQACRDGDLSAVETVARHYPRHIQVADQVCCLLGQSCGYVKFQALYNASVIGNIGIVNLLIDTGVNANSPSQVCSDVYPREVT